MAEGLYLAADHPNLSTGLRSAVKAVVQGSGAAGGENRCSPVGGAAKGMPLNARTPSVSVPKTGPKLVCTSSGSGAFRSASVNPTGSECSVPEQATQQLANTTSKNKEKGAQPVLTSLSRRTSTDRVS